MAEKLCEELLLADIKDDADFNLWMLDKFKVSGDFFSSLKSEILNIEYFLNINTESVAQISKGLELSFKIILFVCYE